MQLRPKALAKAVIVSLALAGMAGQAQATCNLTGKWRMSTTADYSSGAFVAAGCPITIRVNGAFTGVDCKFINLGQAVQSGPVSGTLKTNAKCEVSGVLKAPGVADTTVIGGFANPTMAVLAGGRGSPAIQVRLVILMKE